MKQKYVIENYDQLKAVSDPLRVNILTYLVENAYTGKQLGDLLDLSPSKVHYHLKELENVGLVEVVDTKLKNGIVQKFFKSVAYSYHIDEKLLPHMNEIKQSIRQNVYMVLSRAQHRVIAAPEAAFLFKSTDVDNNPFIANQVEVRILEEKFIEWKKKYNKLLKELEELEDDTGKWFYLANVGFQIESPLFVSEEEKKEDEED